MCWDMVGLGDLVRSRLRLDSCCVWYADLLESGSLLLLPLPFPLPLLGLAFAAFAFTALLIFFGLKCVSAASGGFLGHVGVVLDQECG